MRICMLSSVHSADDIRIVEKEARALAAAGHNVTVVAKPPIPQNTRGLNFRLLDLPAVSRWKRPWIMGRAAFSLVQSLNPEVVQFHDPELIPFALALQRRGCKIIYDVHEDVPADIYSKAWIPGPLKSVTAKIVEAVERLTAKRFDAIVAATPTIAGRFRRYGADVSVVRNSVRLEEFTVSTSEAPRKRQAVYVGHVSFNRGLIEMVEGCEGARLPLVIAGSVGVQEQKWLKTRAANVDLRGKLGRPEIALLLNESMVGLCLFHPEPNHLYAMPTKIFEYMAAALPIITSDLPRAKEIVEGAHCGFANSVKDQRGLVDKISSLLSDPEQARQMGKNGLDMVSKNYSWEHDAAELNTLYRKLSPHQSTA
jgi:hypothetical protein